MLLMEILNIYAEEQLLLKYGEIKHSKLLNIQYMMGIKMILIQWFINFLTKSVLVLTKNWIGCNSEI